MVDAIREFGFRIPVVATSNGEIVDGHLRYKAAKKMGLRHVPVALADNLTPDQVKAFRILANKSATWAGWDKDLLRLELGDLRMTGFDLLKTGFLKREIAPLFGEDQSGAGGQVGAAMKFQVVVECDGEAEQAEVMELLRERGLTCRPVIL